MNGSEKLKEIAKFIRYLILISSSEAGSGHPTSSLSAVEIMTTLFFAGYFKYDLKNPENPNNDRLIFSKGHASPLFYSLFAAAGAITEEEMRTFRKFGSRLEGHPTLNFPFTEAPTGSLGQGLSIGLGMALNAKYLDKLPYKTYVLLGDSEMAEGSVWEALQIANYYKLNNLIGIIDANRLGQSRETLYGHNVEAISKRIAAFGWHTINIDGHSMDEIKKAFSEAQNVNDAPVMIVAKTFKGRGISFLENKDNWHGKALNTEQLQKALLDLGEIDKKIKGILKKPQIIQISKQSIGKIKPISYQPEELVATRKAYGEALVRIASKYPEVVVLDAEVSNSTFSENFKKSFPEKFFEMFIAEQNMVNAAMGLSKRGKIPFVSTFAAFLSRAFDQIRMSQYANSNIKFIGSHAGVSIGEDGSSQMGLEDIAMFRSLLNSVVLYPSDAVSAEKLVEEAVKHKGNVYIRTTRNATPVIYNNDENFPIGGSKTLKSSKKDVATIVTAGITLHEALKAHEELKKENILVRVVDLYSIKPLDVKTLEKAAKETKAIITVEDHFEAGGIGEAVKSALSENLTKIYSLTVRKMPKSGKPQELLVYEKISADAIYNKVKKVIK